MNWILNKKRTLFFKLFVSFLAIISLFCLFYILIYYVFKTSLQEEIVQNSHNETKNTAERFSNHMEQIQIMLFHMYNNQDLVAFNRQLQRVGLEQADYLKAKNVMMDIRGYVYNSLFLLEDVIVHFPKEHFAFGKSGSSSSDYMFNTSYQSVTYPLEHWEILADQPHTFLISPAASFHMNAGSPESRRLLPYTFKKPGTAYQIIAMVNIEKAVESFFGTTDGHTLTITDDQSNILYHSGSTAEGEAIPVFQNGETALKENGRYYFKAEAADGLTYITSLADTRITDQLQRMTSYMVLIFAFSLLAATLVSLYLSRRLHTPVKHMLSSLLDRTSRNEADDVRAGDSIWEYDLIQSRIGELKKEKDTIVDKLNRQNAILTNYSYMNQLKNINTDLSEWNDFLADGGSYQIVYYDIRFRISENGSMPLDREGAVRHLLDYIHLQTKEIIHANHTFQMEKNEIVSILKGASAIQLQALLEQLKASLDEENHFYVVTICTLPATDQPTKFSETYQQLRDLASEARLLEETQLISEARPLPDLDQPLVKRGREFDQALQALEEDTCMEWIRQAFAQFVKKEASVLQFKQLALAITSHINEFMDQHLPCKGAATSLSDWEYMLQDCHSQEDYESVFKHIIYSALAVLRDNKLSPSEEPTIAMFYEIINSHYMEDISLEYLSEKLNLSTTYLSVYIKDKTGINFSEHLQKIRMGKACELLATTNWTINEISVRVGYQNITSFNRIFKKTTGISPGIYRKQHLMEVHHQQKHVD
ncbi:helix-turn-helix domain-containing protein [Paenibacillus xylanilyticus]|uniref:helix-turn-helix domain-containing protein n=1 Tax=Paenibacillus xylanilyticus TaxID=248903 RepID=UPI0039A2245D